VKIRPNFIKLTRLFGDITRFGCSWNQYF